MLTHTLNHTTRHPMLFLEGEGGEGGGGSASLLANIPEGGGEGGGGSTQQQQQVGFTERPEWLPEKFWVDGKPAFDQLATSYKGLEQLLGKKANAIVIPGEGSKPEEIAAFRKALGVPEKPDGYQLKPEQLPDGVQVREENLAKFAAIAHEHNVTPAAMKQIIGAMVEIQAADAKSAEDAAQAEGAQAVETLKNELWKGQDFVANLKLAERAARTFGIDPKSPGLSDPYVVAGLVKAAKQISEGKLVKGEDVSGLMDGPARAKSIRTNPSDPLYQKYQEGDADTVALARSLDAQA